VVNKLRPHQQLAAVLQILQLPDNVLLETDEDCSQLRNGDMLEVLFDDSVSRQN
jgi:hypothetical protein